MGAPAINILETDADLVALYRFKEFVANGYLTNNTLAPAWSGYNNMDTSGTPVQAPEVSPMLSDGSGAQFDNSSDVFHTHVSGGGGGVPQSGLEVSSTTPFSFGFWGKVSGAFVGEQAWFSKYTASTSGAYYKLAAQNSVDDHFWELSVGKSNGGITSVIDSNPITVNSGAHEFICATITPDTSTMVLYVDATPVASSTLLTFGPGPSGVDIVDVPIRLGAARSFSSMGLTSTVGFAGGLISNAFFMRRALTPQEVSGVYQSGFVPDLFSDTNDTLKDNIGFQGNAEIIMTAWDPTELANPSGLRHLTTGIHPAFTQVIGVGATSGLNFGRLLQSTTSGTKAIVFRNATSETRIGNLRFWLKDYGAFPTSGWNIAAHVNSDWLDLTLPSGSGILGKTLGDAISVLRSDGETSISGYVIDGTSSSGEQEVSQYIYLAFNADFECPPATYGPDDFGFRLTVDNV